MTAAAPEGKARTEATQAKQEEAPAGEASEQPSKTVEDPATLPTDVAALLNLLGMVKTLQRMVAKATAKVQAHEAAKVADLERSMVYASDGKARLPHGTGTGTGPVPVPVPCPFPFPFLPFLEPFLPFGGQLPFLFGTE